VKYYPICYPVSVHPQAVLSVCDPEWKTLTLCGLYTGQRLSDLASLRWSNIDLINNQLRFVAAKTGRTMILPLATPLRKHLEALPSSDDPLAPLHPRAFAIRARSVGPSTLSYQFGEILTQAGLRPKAEGPSAGDNRTHILAQKTSFRSSPRADRAGRS
jgi:integrase